MAPFKMLYCAVKYWVFPTISWAVDRDRPALCLHVIAVKPSAETRMSIIADRR